VRQPQLLSINVDMAAVKAQEQLLHDAESALRQTDSRLAEVCLPCRSNTFVAAYPFQTSKQLGRLVVPPTFGKEIAPVELSSRDGGARMLFVFCTPAVLRSHFLRGLLLCKNGSRCGVSVELAIL
jgi:hypothetical protein